jgi:hypothetical protein
MATALQRLSQGQCRAVNIFFPFKGGLVDRSFVVGGAFPASLCIFSKYRLVFTGMAKRAANNRHFKQASENISIFSVSI